MYHFGHVCALFVPRAQCSDSVSIANLSSVSFFLPYPPPSRYVPLEAREFQPELEKVREKGLYTA
jgi:hypothetical protein